MPKTPIDYSKTIIYKLVHNEDYDNINIYICSTTDFLKRTNQHKNSCNNEKKQNYNDKKYQYIRDNGGWNEWNMIEIQKYPCNDGNEARAREEYWRSHFNAQLNMVKSYTTYEERLEQKKRYNHANKEKRKEYYEQNKDKINEKITCECGCIIRRINIPRHVKSQKHLMKIGILKYEFVDDNDDN